MKLARSVDEVLSAIDTLNDSLTSEPELAARLGQAHAYYAKPDGAGGHRFGFSKFIGYADQTAARYLRKYKDMDGRNTEFALAKWFDEVRYGTPLYNALLGELGSWMAQFGKKPREGKQQKLRLMVPKPEFDTPAPTGSDRRLLDLIIAVTDMLPTDQRRALRAVL